MKKLLGFLLIMLTGTSAKPMAAADPFDAFLVYPQQIRNAVIEALIFPQVMLGLMDLQGRTSKEFRAFYQGLPKDMQKKVLKLAPFPNLVHDLAVSGQSNPAAREAALKGLPLEAREDAKDLLNKNPEVLSRLDQLDDGPLKEYEALIQNLPASGKTAYLQLLRHAEILKTLAQIFGINANNLSDFKRNPSSLNSKIQDLSKRLAQAATPAEPKLAAAKGDDPKALGTLQKQADSINSELDTEIKVDPKPAGAVQMNVSFTPYPFYNPYTDHWMFPYWFGFDDWFF